MYSGTRQIAERLGLREPVACIDGSHIVDSTTHTELASVPVPSHAVNALFQILSQSEPIAFVFSGDRVYFDGKGAEYLPYVTTWSEQTSKLGRVLDAEQWGNERPIAALVAMGAEELIADAHAAISEHAELMQSACFPLRRYDGLWGMVVRAARVDKGTALEWLAAHHGVTPEEMVAVGDWLNDIPMLRRAGRTFAMGQAPDEVKAAATDVLEADMWSGGGIAEAAERAGLL